MIKASVFTLGIVSGLYLGVHLREQGYTSGITKAYYTFKNERSDHMKQHFEKKPNVDDVFEYYQKGLIDIENTENVLDQNDFDKLDEINLNPNTNRNRKV